MSSSIFHMALALFIMPGGIDAIDAIDAIDGIEGTDGGMER